MNGLKIIYGNRKYCLVYHAFKHGAAYCKIDTLVNGGKLRKFVCFNSYNAVFRCAAFYFCHAFFVALNFDIFGIKTADYVGKKLCIKYNGAVFVYPCGKIGFYSKLHVIA